MNAKKIATAALGSLLLVGGTAYAAPGDGGPHGRHGAMRADAAFVRMLKLADADKDGKVTKEEADAGFLKIFDTVDADKNGAATPGEFRAYMQARMEEFRKNNPPPADAPEGGPEQAMRDGGPDGERRGPPPPHDRDGPRHHADRDGGPRGEGRHGPHGEGKHGWGHGWFGKGDDRDRPSPASFLIRKADKDENGQVSRDEAKAFGETIFTRLDTNKDGTFSIDDLPDRPFP